MIDISSVHSNEKSVLPIALPLSSLSLLGRLSSFGLRISLIFLPFFLSTWFSFSFWAQTFWFLRNRLQETPFNATTHVKDNSLSRNISNIFQIDRRLQTMRMYDLNWFKVDYRIVSKDVRYGSQQIKHANLFEWETGRTHENGMNQWITR